LVNYPIQFEGSLEEANQVPDIIIPTTNGTPVYLRDIAFVNNGLETPKTYSRVSVLGKPSQNAITLLIHKKSGGDVTAIIANVRSKIEELKQGMLKGADVVVSIDAGERVKKDLKELSRTGRIKEVDTFYGSLAELKKYRWQSIVSKGNQKLDEQGNPAVDPNTGEPKYWDDNMEFKFRYKPPSFVPCIDIVSSFNEQVQLDLGSPENKEAIKHKPGKERKVYTPDWHCLPNKKWKKLVFFFDGVIFTDKGPKLWITPRKIVVDVEPKYNFISKTSTADKAAMVMTSSSSSSSSSSSAAAAPVPAPVVSSSVVSSSVVPSPLVSSLPTKVDITKDTNHKIMNDALAKKKE
jgi:hypothetical protein